MERTYIQGSFQKCTFVCEKRRLQPLCTKAQSTSLVFQLENALLKFCCVSLTGNENFISNMLLRMPFLLGGADYKCGRIIKGALWLYFRTKVSECKATSTNKAILKETLSKFLYLKTPLTV